MKLRIKNKSIHFIMLALFLSFLCLGSTGDYLYSNSRNTVEVEDDDSQMLSVKNHQITQLLRLEGDLSKVVLFVSAPNGAGYEDAEVQFLISQGDKVCQKIVYAKDMESTYTLEVPRFKFGVGEANLYISGKQFPEETDLFVFCSHTQTSGLGSAEMDGNLTLGPLLMNYMVIRHDRYFVYDTVFVALLIITIGIVSWLITYKKRIAEETGLLFVCSAVLLFVYISLRNPVATFQADPLSEMTYEFWYKARYMSFFENMMSLMSGESLVWTERLLMWLAVKLAGDGRYVFVIAQIMQTILISSFSSMICLPTFRRWLPSEARLLVCWYIGGAMLFPSAYYFWAVSYWASFFLIPFAFVNMEKMKRWQYVLAMILTVILCVSRIYHILYIPMALLALVALGKHRGKRFSLYCLIVAISSTFEVVYSMCRGGSGHLDLSQLKPIQFLNNAVYYQVQVMRSLFLGDGKFQHTMTNGVFLILFLAVVCIAVQLLVFNWKNFEKRTYGTILLILGVLSFGSVLINVTVSGCSTSVVFPVDYAAPIKWCEDYYQIGDLHFSYSYYAIVLIVIVLVTLILRDVKDEQCLKKKNIGFVAIITMIVCINNQGYYSVRMVETDWKSCYWVTNNDSYYMPINAPYQYANISLYHNSTSIICGKTDDGEEVSWMSGNQTYSSTYEYSTISPGKISDLEERGMLALAARKTNVNFLDPIVAVLRNERGEEITRVVQTNMLERYLLNFMLKEPIYGVYTVDFEYEDGRPAKVKDGVQIGVTLGE